MDAFSFAASHVSEGAAREVDAVCMRAVSLFHIMMLGVSLWGS